MPGEPASRQSAQQRADRIRSFREELAALEQEGVLRLEPEQREGMNRHLDSLLASLQSKFDVDVNLSEKQFSWGMRVAVTLGGLALCAGLVLFFYRYWGDLSTAVQVAVLVAAPLVAVAVTELSARREKTLYFAALAAMVAVALFILDLYAVGSIFNITSSPNAFAAWSIFAFAVAYQYRLRLLLTIALITAGIWFSGTILSLNGISWNEFGRRPEIILLAAAVAYLAGLKIPHLRNPDFPAVYRWAALIGGFVALLSLAGGGELSFLHWPGRIVERMYEAIGWVASIGFIALGIRRGWRGDVNIAAAFFAIFLYVRLYRWWWDWMPRYLFFLAIGAVAIGLVLAFRRLRERSRSVPA